MRPQSPESPQPQKKESPLTRSESLLQKLDIQNFGDFKTQIEVYTTGNPGLTDYLRTIDLKTSTGYTSRANQFRLICFAHFLIEKGIILTDTADTHEVFKKIANPDNDIPHTLFTFYVEIPCAFAKKQTSTDSDAASSVLERVVHLTSGATQSIQTGWLALSAALQDLWSQAQASKIHVERYANQRFFVGVQPVSAITAGPESQQYLQKN